MPDDITQPGGWQRRARVLGSDLAPAERLTLLALEHHADPDGRAWPSDALLAAETGLSRPTIRRARASLTRAGIVTIEDARHLRSLRVRIDFGAIPARASALTMSADDSTVCDHHERGRGASAITMSADDSTVCDHHERGPGASALTMIGRAITMSARTTNEPSDSKPQPPPPPPEAPPRGGGVGVEGLSALTLVRRERPPAPLRLAAAPAVGEGLAELERVGVSPSVARALAAEHPADEIRAVVASVTGAKGVQDRAAVVVAALRRGDGPDLVRRQRDAQAKRASVAASGATGGNGPSLAERGALERANLEAARAADAVAAWIGDPRNAADVARLLAEYRDQPLRPGVGVPDARVTGSGLFRAWAGPRIAALQGVAA